MSEVTAAAKALTLACMRRAGVPADPLCRAYDHVACEPLPSAIADLLAQLGAEQGTA